MDVQRRFQKWDGKGRPPQEAFEWENRNWRKYLGEKSILETLPNPIDRAGVLEAFKRVHDPDSALDAYVASYLWGYAKAGFGPYRAERVIRLNTDLENEKNFAAELHTLARITMEDGGTAAFGHVVTFTGEKVRKFIWVQNGAIWRISAGEKPFLLPYPANSL